MDTTDPLITFDNQGFCSHCHYFVNTRLPVWKPTAEGKKILDEEVHRIKKKRKGFEYDLMIGLSGGVDSSYLAYFLMKEYDLRILAVHVDTGWNTELAVSNVENIVKHLNLDLYTYVVDWEEMSDLQLSFLKAGVVNQDTPQDHAIFAAVYKIASKFSIHDFFVGYNLQTESILPKSWQGLSAMDPIQLKAISKRFGTKKLKRFPLLGLLMGHLYYPRIYKIDKFPVLNYLPYNKTDAKQTIIKELGWQDYGVKHGESKFTKIFQSYILPKKCGFDKRRAHLSSLILAKEISREDALEQIKESVYPDKRVLNNELNYLAKKLYISRKELDQLIESPCRHYSEYPHAQDLLASLREIKKIIPI